MDTRETIHQGWLEFTSESGNSKSWMRLSKKSSWKRKYFVLYHLSEDVDKVYLVTYDKDENWHCTEPKKILELFPRYRIAKLQNYKGKESVLEVNNEIEQWYLTSDKPKILDLWATQIQMQTKLSRAISGRIFSVSGAVNKQMQKIGAAQQRCLLHFTRWGITLALQDSRAILAMWPMKTIRNYESSQCKFTVEAGRKAPMGEGLFVFHTNVGQEEQMFNVMDAFITAGLHEKADLGSNKKVPNTDDEILQIYDALHKAALGINHEGEPPSAHRLPIDTPGYAPLGGGITPSISRDSISICKPPDYNRLFNDSGSRRHETQKKQSPEDSNYNHLFDEQGRSLLKQDFSSPSSFHGCETPRGLSFSDNASNASNYDQLDRKASWETRPFTSEYDHINQQAIKQNDGTSTYDKINRTQQETSFSNVDERQRLDHGFAGYPLRDEPSVPFLNHDDNEKPFTGRSPLSQTPDKYEFRNSIYTPNSNKEKEEIYQNNPSEASSLSQTPDDCKYEFRNSIYTPVTEDTDVVKENNEVVDLPPEDNFYSNSTSPINSRPLKENNEVFDPSVVDLPPEDNFYSNSTSPNSRRVPYTPTKQRASSSFKDRPLQDIADHFLYQMPSSFTKPSEIREFDKQSDEQQQTSELLDEDEVYQNAASARLSISTPEEKETQ